MPTKSDCLSHVEAICIGKRTERKSRRGMTIFLCNSCVVSLYLHKNTPKSLVGDRPKPAQGKEADAAAQKAIAQNQQRKPRLSQNKIGRSPNQPLGGGDRQNRQAIKPKYRNIGPGTASITSSRVTLSDADSLQIIVTNWICAGSNQKSGMMAISWSGSPTRELNS